MSHKRQSAYVKRWNKSLGFAILNLFLGLIAFSITDLTIDQFDNIVVLAIGISFSAFVTMRMSSEPEFKRRWTVILLAPLISGLSWLFLVLTGEFTISAGLQYLVISLFYGLLMGVFIFRITKRKP